jgi:hypothetical protein
MDINAHKLNSAHQNENINVLTDANAGYVFDSLPRQDAPEALDSSDARNGLPIISLIFWAIFRLLINRHPEMSRV